MDKLKKVTYDFPTGFYVGHIALGSGVEHGYFITKEQVVNLLKTALNNSGAIYDYDIERNLKDLGVE